MLETHCQLHIPRAPIPIFYPEAGVHHAAASDIGLIRELNQDRFGAYPEMGLFMVADGMGGHPAGEIAAQIAVDVMRWTLSDPDITWPESNLPPGHAGARLLRAAMHRANDDILRSAARDPSRKGMGTTLVSLMLADDLAVVAHAGDSRAYRLRRGRLERLTEDHSLRNELAQAWGMRPDDLRYQASRHLITRYLGMQDLRADAAVHRVLPGDVFLLCTDGLCGVVAEPWIASMLAVSRTPAEAVNSLIESAKAHGGPDNITAIVVEA